ncbi:MAG TPA: sigma-70 family RNA polymerase sigma factor [Planctomycetota bacterium]|jgi:RNA polymerase sigma-70 factor (ECF subfamily)|nr:sigma-70 family RNA polymerase sigma factor [Planctomycetota bacterium]
MALAGTAAGVMSRDEVVKAAFRYRDALLSYAFALLRDWAQAEDVVQDAFIVVMNKWTDFRPGTSVYFWVRQIVHHKCQEAMRARMRLGSTLDEELLAKVGAALRDHLDEEAADRQARLRQALEACMASLEPRALGLLAGFYGRCESCETLARHQRRSVNAVRLALSRLRRRLQGCIRRRLSSFEAQG